MIEPNASDGGFRHERVQTGIPPFDEILRGGFPANSINIVMGHPGTGKTIFTEQVAFHNVGGRPILYLTTLSEPLAKVVTYLQGFSFYDESLLMDGIIYEDVGGDLAQNGAEVIVHRVRQAVRELGPKMIVIDSFKAIHDLARSPNHMRRLISELAGVLTAYDTTTFLVGEYTEDQIPVFPEFAVADGIIEFARRSSAKRDDRFVRVMKLRGSGYAEGFHAFTITADGLNVFPRLVTPSIGAAAGLERERIPTGVEGLDALLDGGLWRGSTALVTGQAGSGKTTLGLQFAIEGVRQGEPSLFVNFQENPAQLNRTVRALGVDVEDLRSRGLMFLYASPVELSIDSLVVELFSAVGRDGIRRVVIDAIGDLAIAAADQQRFHDYLYSLCQHLIVAGVTTLMTFEVHTHGSPTFNPARFSSMSDTLIELDIDISGPPRRTFRVAKARGIAHDMRPHEMRIDSGGVRIGEPLEPR